MDTQTYISSGVLELYVLDLLTTSEKQEVETNCKQYADIQAEKDRLEIVLEKYAFDHEKQPSAKVKEKVLQQIADIQAKGKQADIIPIAPPKKILNWLSVAAILLCVGAIALSIALWNNQQKANQTLADNQQSLQHLEKELAIAKNPAFRHIQLNATDSTKETSALVFWNPKTNEVFLESGQLASLPSDKQYQLWAIIGGKPTDMGVFDTANDIQKMKIAAQPQAFAVTIEKKGGSVAPTLTAMIVLGKV